MLSLPPSVTLHSRGYGQRLSKLRQSNALLVGTLLLCCTAAFGATTSDFDGDGKSDLAVWRQSTGTFYVIPSKIPNSPVVQQWGTNGDIPVPGDYDGDGKNDFAVFRPSTGTWYVIPSSNPISPNVQQWGTNGDIPTPGDFDGDGKTDFAVFRPSTGTWYVIPSSSPGSPIVQQWGTLGDIPVPGDYDGDGKTDFAVFRPSSGTWYVIPSSNASSPISQQWGTSGDVPVPGDYDGDRKNDFAVFRPSSGTWYVIPTSSPNNPTSQQWGTGGDVPVPGDYDGDGKTDYAVWRASEGNWYIIPSGNPGTPIVHNWGTIGDTPSEEPSGSVNTSGLFHAPPNPVNISVMPDLATSVTQVVSAASGGTVTATGADGSVFTLTIPANALLSDESITMTPLSSVGNLPVSGGLLAGVQLLPEGLLLQQAATLTIHTATNVPVSQQVGFGFHGAGQEFYFQPLELSSTITISVLHFSGAGVGQGTAGNGGNPTSPADQLSQQASSILNQERQCQLSGTSCDPNVPEEIAELLQEYYTEVIQPLAQQALTDDSVAQTAIQAMTGWARQVQLLGLDQDEPFSSEVQTALSQIQPILQNVYNKSFGRCVNDTSQGQRMIEGQKMLSVERSLQLLGSEPNPNFADQLAACIAGPVNFTLDSTVSGSQGVPSATTYNIQSTVSAQQIPLTFDATSLSYSGNGLLNYQAHTYSVDWGIAGWTDCSSGIGNSGTIAIKATFDLNVSPYAISNPNQLRFNIALTPNVTEADTTCAIVMGIVTSAPPVTNTDYDSYLDVAHGGSFGSPANSPYFVNLNTPVEYQLSGSWNDSGVIFSSQENSTLTLAQTSP